MPPKKGSPNKSGSPKDKKSPKGSPKKGSPKKDGAEEEKPFWPEPRVETPPPQPPRGPGIHYVRRQPWYPYINNPDFTYSEYSWNPFCPVLTSWGHLWVSDPQNRKIWRYKLDPCLDDHLVKLPDIITRGEPFQIFETPGTGRVLALIRCPTARKTTLTQFSPDGIVENVRDYPFEMPFLGGDTQLDPDKPASYLDEGRPLGVTADKETVYVLRNPIQRMELLEYRKLTPVEFALQGWSKQDPMCVHLATSGGCAAGNGLLYVAATRPPRIFVFQIIKEWCFRIIDRITVRALFEFGMERIKQPYCLRLDSLSVLGVSDSQWGFLRAFHYGGVETSSFGGWKVDELRPVRAGHFSVSKNGIICLVDHHKNHLKFFIDRVMFKWYRDTLFYLDKMAWYRPIVDKEMPPLPPVRRPDPYSGLKNFKFIIWPLDDPDGIWPRPPKEQPPTEEEANKSPDKKGKDSPKKDKKSPKKDSPKSKDSKKGKK